MKPADRKCVFMALGLLLAAIVLWLRSNKRKEPHPGTRAPEGRMLLDDDAAPAPFSLVQPEEHRTFHVDDRSRPFALHDDLDDRSEKPRSVHDPMALEERRED